MQPYYQDEAVTIYHGDCREILPGLRGDLVLTDPPYKLTGLSGGGIIYKGAFYREGALSGMDDFDLSDYGAALLAAAPMLIAFHSRDLIQDYAALARDSGRTYDLHIWHKTNAIPFTCKTWKSDLEYIALIWERKPGWRQLDQIEHSKVYSSPINNGDQSHPTAKPIPLLARYIRTLEPGVVLDPFMGSGTTLRAAKDLGRSAIGIEIEERYCEIAAKRMSQGVLPLAEGR